jgi:phosphoglycerate dehydrogenase-like enzyme
VPNLTVNAVANEPFWQLPGRTEAALRAALPPSFHLEVCRDAAALPGLVRDSTAVLGWPFAPALARRAPALRWVHAWTAGLPESWYALAGERLRLTTSAGLNAHSVAEHALLFVLAALRGVRASSFATRAFEPGHYEVARAPGRMRASVIGHGHVGQRLVALLRPLFGELRVVSRTPRPSRDGSPDVLGFEALLDVVRESDVIVLCLPLTADTRAALLAPTFYAALRPDVSLVNVARGELIDEAALLAHLAANPAARYFSDVAQPEPYPAAGALWASPQVVLTPHVAGRRDDQWEKLEAHTVELLGALLPELSGAT